jgi:hypothetical protein
MKQSTRFLLAIAASVMLTSSMVTNAQTTITVWDKLYVYPDTPELLRLALEKTVAEYGPYEMVKSAPMGQKRAIEELEQRRGLDVLALPTSPEREEQMLPIRIPYLKGLLGLRICFIRPGEQSRFDDVRSIEDWQKSNLIIGAGAHWPDSEILRYNGFDLVTVASSSSLPEMLKRGRFDCLLYSVSDIMIHKQCAACEELAIEESMLLIYPNPQFFFVNKSDRALHQRIKLGLERAISDGSYLAVFNETHSEAVKQLNVMNREHIYLENPFISKATLESMQQEDYLFIPQVPIWPSR